MLYFDFYVVLVSLFHIPPVLTAAFEQKMKFALDDIWLNIIES